MFSKISNIIEKQLNDYIVHIKKLYQLFDDIPVVGMIYSNSTFTTSGESNRAVISYQIFTSSPMKYK